MDKPITLKQYLKEPHIEATKRRKQIVEECGISYRMLLNWIGGRTPVPKLAREKIEAITGKKFHFKEIEDGRTKRRKTA